MHHWHLERRYGGFYDGMGGTIGSSRTHDNIIGGSEINLDELDALVHGGGSIPTALVIGSATTTASTVDPALAAFFGSLKHGAGESAYMGAGESDDSSKSSASSASDDDFDDMVAGGVCGGAIDSEPSSQSESSDTADTFFDHMLADDTVFDRLLADDTVFDRLLADDTPETAADMFE